MRAFKTIVAIFGLCLVSLVAGQQLQINYYSDHYCNNYQASLKVGFAESMASSGTNCYNFQYGQSMLISDCYSGSFCMCQLYSQQNCAGDYASIQSSGYDRSKWYEYNCIFNGNTRKSMRCWYF